MKEGIPENFHQSVFQKRKCLENTTSEIPIDTKYINLSKCFDLLCYNEIHILL